MHRYRGAAAVMEARAHPKNWDVSTAALVLANGVPIAGVLFFHWQVFPLMLLYWLENVVVGLFNVLRTAFAVPGNPVGWAGKLFLIPFFCVHFGMFTFVHGVFVFALFGGNKFGNPFSLVSIVPHAIRQTRIELAVLSIIASHGISFLTNYLHGGEYRRATLQQLMSQPYSRVVVLHFAILGGGFAMMALGSPLIGLVLLVVLKTGIDIAAHRAERRKLAGPGPEPMRAGWTVSKGPAA